MQHDWRLPIGCSSNRSYALVTYPMSHRFSPLVVQAAAAIGANLLLSAAGLAAPAAGSGGVPALYRTQAEAEKAAKQHFNCTGAHKMGDRWMPCAKHGDAHGSGTSH
jgi:hypothetical protein